MKEYLKEKFSTWMVKWFYRVNKVDKMMDSVKII